MENKFLLIGAGPMAVEYAKVLLALNIEFIVVGKGQESAVSFEKQTGKKVITGGVEKWIQSYNLPEINDFYAIVAVNEDLLGYITKVLINAGLKNILVEKPGGLNFDDINKVNALANEKNANVYIGYNRRFFASTLKVKELIENDGGLTSFNFEFTEWGHIIKTLKKNEGVLEEWFMHNSSHVIDLAFYIGGKPTELCSFTAGGESWHPQATIFSGAGVSEKGALFSYNANWESAGRWWVEFLTNKHRFIMKPMEKLFIQKRGSITVEEVSIDDNLDKLYKPGLYKQVLNFAHKTQELLKIQEQVSNLTAYKSIIKY